MIGFFEYQYLSYKKQHLMNLIALAHSDGNFHEKEIEIIYKIGKKYQLKTKHIDALLESRTPQVTHLSGGHDENMEQMHDLVELMLADGIIAETEIEFCERMLDSMGYDAVLLGSFIKYIKTPSTDQQSWIAFKSKALDYKLSKYKITG